MPKRMPKQVATPCQTDRPGVGCLFKVLKLRGSVCALDSQTFIRLILELTCDASADSAQTRGRALAQERAHGQNDVAQRQEQEGNTAPNQVKHS
jgi:hypothetical protein